MHMQNAAMSGVTRTLFVLATAAVCLGCDPGDDGKEGAEEGIASLDVNPGAVHFEAYLSDGMQTRTVSLQNHGTGVLHLSEVQASAEAGEFTIVEGIDRSTSSLSIPARTQKWITIAWDPTSGDASGSLFFATNDPQKPAAELELSALVQSSIEDPVAPVDEEMVDVYLLLDVAYNYSCYHPELDRFIVEVIDALYAHFGNVAVGFGVYDDYREGDWATVGLPYEMHHAISTDHGSVKDAAESLRMEYGGSDEGSAYEAIYQAVWGAGFDHNCNGEFDSNTDIRPWAPMESDAFEGSVEGLESTFPADGTRRGVGWREGAAHIVLYSIDNIIRDAALGSRFPESSCGEPATADTVATALGVTDTRLLAINVYEWQSSDVRPQAQIVSLAEATGSYIDADGDGVFDDPAVLADGWNWPSMSAIMGAVEDLIRTSD